VQGGERKGGCGVMWGGCGRIEGDLGGGMEEKEMKGKVTTTPIGLHPGTGGSWVADVQSGRVCTFYHRPPRKRKNGPMAKLRDDKTKAAIWKEGGLADLDDGVSATFDGGTRKNG